MKRKKHYKIIYNCSPISIFNFIWELYIMFNLISGTKITDSGLSFMSQALDQLKGLTSLGFIYW